MIPSDVEDFFVRLRSANPHPRTELDYSNAFTLLVAVVLSAQATDAGVNRATARLFALADTPASMVALGEHRIRDEIRTLGLFNVKAKNIAALSLTLTTLHKGKVPHDRAALEALPGVGRKTANVVLNEIFGDETCAVDTHIFRVSNRTGLALGRTPRAVEDILMQTVPKIYRRSAHHWLLLHGRYICLAQTPSCAICPVNDLCAFTAKTATLKMLPIE